ncbi:hypothetical protein P12x_005121 [Tundrisphaera lichenicola]|uniref:hypothetical protein n=1 Tax=Tundrisphaera lichenicola TaxID=2029860 RepID=UPI003EBA538D
MSEHLWKIVLVVAMTHGFRELGRRFGPRWGALALGLPCSTAVLLVGCGSDRGVDESVQMAGSCLIGLIGASALPVAFAWSLGRGSGPWRSASMGVAAYLMMAPVAALLDPPTEFAAPAVVAAILVAARLAARTPLKDAITGRMEPSRGRTLALRTMVPVACLSASIALGNVLGPGGAGLMIAFPAVTLTVLVLTSMEAGSLGAIRMARALPMANLGMVAFLLVFRLACPVIGLGLGTTYAYLASLLALGLVLAARDHRGTIASGPHRRRDSGRPGSLAGPNVRMGSRPDWPRAGRRFSPLVESFAN